MLHIDELKSKLLSFDKAFAERRIIAAIKQYFEKTGVKYAILGLSGGVDSSVAFVLTVKALGKERVKCLIMPHTKITPKGDIEDAFQLATQHGVEPILIEIDAIAEEFRNRVVDKGIDVNRVTYGNILARTRMILLYTFANSFNGLVVGSGDKSELLLGYFTKYGDGGVDILPIGDLYKTQVRELARHLGIPERIAYKPSSPRLWPDQTAENELGASYEVIDPILYALVELRKTVEEVLEIKGVSKELIKSVLRRVFSSEHKRRFPLIPKLSPGLTIGIDWRIPRISDIA